MTDKTHWNNIYNKKDPNEVSWYQPTPNISLTLIESLNVSKGDSIIDVGGGANTIVFYRKTLNIVLTLLKTNLISH